MESIQRSHTVDVVIPCYNPQEGWAEILFHRIKELQSLMPDIGFRWILVNDGSSRNVSKDEVDFLNKSLVDFSYLSYELNRGKGYAVRQGVKKAKSEVIGFTDIDFPYSSQSFASMFEEIIKGADIVVGHRTAAYYDSIPFFRRCLSKGLKSIIKLFLRIPVSDTQSGLKLFNSKGADVLLACQIDRYLFDFEFIKIAARKNLNIQSTTLKLREGVVLGAMPLRVVFNELSNLIFILFRK